MELEGILVRRASVNKRQQVLPGSGDIYLALPEGEIFIRLLGSPVSRAALEVWEGKRVRLTAEKLRGLWDTHDPTVQSRYGDYLRVTAIHPV